MFCMEKHILRFFSKYKILEMCKFHISCSTKSFVDNVSTDVNHIKTFIVICLSMVLMCSLKKLGQYHITLKVPMFCGLLTQRNVCFYD